MLTYGLIIPLGMISGIVLAALKAVGRPDLSLRNVSAGAGLMITAFVIGAQWGLTGLSLAWLVAYPLYFVATLVRSAPVLGTTAGAVLARLARPLMASALMLATVEFLRAPAADALVYGPARLAALVLAGAAVYGAAMLTFGRGPFAEAMSLLHPGGGRREAPVRGV
jgi:hypothetical protein